LTASRSDRRWTWASRALLVVLAGVMLATVLDYGITADAGVQHRWGRRLLRWYASLGAEPRVTDNLDITKYGGFCEMLTELFVLVSPLDVYQSRHVANLGFALVAFLAVLAMGRRLGGAPGAFFSLLFLVLTPRFYGHAFNNAKDVPFAAMFALAVAAVLAADEWPRVRWRRVLLAGTAIGLAAAVRVGAIVLYGFALALWLATLLARALAAGRPITSASRDALRLVLAWVAALAAGWAAMVAFWPWAMLDPLRNPFRAADRFARYWDDMLLFYDGRLLPANQVSRFYLPNWFALTLPESYLVAAALGLVGLALLWRARRSTREALLRLLPLAWLGSLPALLVVGVVVYRMPLYDGLRHFLFLIPLLAVLAGVAVAGYLRSPLSRGARAVGLAALSFSLALTLGDMVWLHPYQAVYFNRLIAGGMKEGIARYEGDYWCLSYKEGCEWLLQRFSGAQCRERIRVAGYSVLQQPQYYLERTDEGRRLFTAVPERGGSPNYVLATTRFQDHLRAPGRLVHTVEREGATLFYLFEVRPPDCDLPESSPGQAAGP
jgi:hypothetical protein